MSAFTNPGVYIEELPNGVHTITGVATSIAVFVGWANQGPTDEATLIESWSDFQTQFGGLNLSSYLGYAVNEFFANGGEQAYIIRLVWTDCLPASSGSVTIGGLTAWARNPGAWGNGLLVSVNLQAGSSGRFCIEVQQAGTNGGQPQTLETFANLSLAPTDPQYVVTVIGNDSRCITLMKPGTASIGIGPNPSGTPAAISQAPLSGGVDGTVLRPGDGNFELTLTTAPGGLHLLDRVDIFNLLCVPEETEVMAIGTLQAYCARRQAFYIVDSPQIATVDTLLTGPAGTSCGTLIPLPTKAASANSAYYFPWISVPDPLSGDQPKLVPPCGFVAGIYASTDASRGVWKAPAGIDASLTGALGMQHNLTDVENGDLNTLGINCLRQFKIYNEVVWGARTLQGNDQAGSQWKYVPIRRLALFLESSLYAGTQWVVFEPNNEVVWGQIRLDIGAFLQGLFVQGAFQGTAPQEAYFVKCDSENNPQSSIDQGLVNILVGFAPLYPAEFVVIQIQQIAGQIQT